MLPPGVVSNDSSSMSDGNKVSSNSTQTQHDISVNIGDDQGGRDAEEENFWKRLLQKIKRLRIRSEIAREMLAELCGVFILVTIGNCSVAQSVLSSGSAGGFLSVNLAYGFGIAIAIYFTGSVSGGHINPAVTIAFAAYQKFPWIKVPFYIIAQIIGGYLSGVCVYCVYYDALNNFDGGTRQILGSTGTAGIFATYPQSFLSDGNGVVDQIVSTGLLVSVIFLMGNKNKNKELSAGAIPAIIGLTVIIIGLSFGFNCGYAINPARDLGPRLFTLSAGWGTHVFKEPNPYWWLVPLLSPILGAILGGGLYQVCSHLFSANAATSSVSPLQPGDNP